ncbi:hypothetical protein [Actinoplanes sp. NPDC049265]|uniref:hypothetical protein n=1 Tax=Actinoplanes sp. NPDC049265 TaxID=3363902 RepID=UPI003719EE71
MNPPVVAPVIPASDPAIHPARGPLQAARGPLPLADLGAPVMATPIAYALSAVDRSGRIADRGIVRALGWTPRQHLDVRVYRGTVVARPKAGATGRVDRRGFLLLPLPVRRRCELHPGDRLLLAADLDAGVLTGYPLPVLGPLLAATQAGGAA